MVGQPFDQCIVKGQNISILKDNSVYRIGDLWYHKGTESNRKRNIVDSRIILSNDEYRKSVLYCYMKNRNLWEHDANMIRQCCKKYQYTSFVAAGNTSVLHLRVGDKSPKYKMNELIRLLHNHPHKKNITIVTAINYSPFKEEGLYLHSTKHDEKACTIIKKIVQYLEHYKYSVSLRSSIKPDEDMCFMAGSRYFIPSYGGLSGLMQCISSGNEFCHSKKHTFPLVGIAGSVNPFRSVRSVDTNQRHFVTDLS